MKKCFNTVGEGPFDMALRAIHKYRFVGYLNHLTTVRVTHPALYGEETVRLLFSVHRVLRFSKCRTLSVIGHSNPLISVIVIG